jgi:hypothetical protein
MINGRASTDQATDIIDADKAINGRASNGALPVLMITTPPPNFYKNDQSN